MAETQNFTAPGGLVALTSPGSVRVETTLSLLAAANFSAKAGLLVEYQHFGGSLVDKARNDACRALLASQNGYVLFADGDMTFAPDAFVRLVHNAYVTHPHFDILGGLCHLRGGAIPTVDTGTGTWESHFAGSGTLEVIRTGAAFLLVKRHVLEKMGHPWFAVRFPQRRLDALYEVDNYARTRLHGAQPFRELPGHPWERLMDMAATDVEATRQQETGGYEIGEDSGFCDRAKALGFRCGVDTDLEIGHIDTTVIQSRTHKEKMTELERQARLLHGVLV
jgi:hypothetical protein